MGHYMTNQQTMDLFKEIDNLKNNDKLSDDQLKEQTKAIQNKIVTELSFLVYSMAKPYIKFPNYEDLVQEGFVGLLKAVQCFDYTRFPNFFVFSEQWIRHHIKRAASKFDVVYNPNKKRVIYSDPIKLKLEEECDPIETPDGAFDAKEKAIYIENLLNDLSKRDQEVLKRIFGLGGFRPQTLREIGPAFNLTHERIRQIKNKAISKLKKNKTLREFSQ